MQYLQSRDLRRQKHSEQQDYSKELKFQKYQIKIMNLKEQFKQRKISIYSLDNQRVIQIAKKLEIKIPSIDWSDCSLMKGKRRLYKGRTFVNLTHKKHFLMLIIDKDHETRFLVEKVEKYRYVNESFSYPFIFHGIKIESNKYFIRGIIQAFQITSFQIHIGFDIINKSSEQFQLLSKARLDQLQGKLVILFCKQHSKNTKTYFDKQNNILKIIKEELEGSEEHQYFGTLMANQQLQSLIQNEAISTIVVSYFFKRLIFSSTSSKWYDKNPSKNIVAFLSEDITSYFACQFPKFKQSFFEEQVISNYFLISQNPFKQLRILFFPIYQHDCYHFVLAALQIDEKKNRINLYELDPLDAKNGAWRSKLVTLLQDIRTIYEGEQCARFLQISQKYLKDSVEQLKFPKQMASNDCGIYICTYALLLLHQLGQIQMHQLTHKIISQVKGQQGYFTFLRYIIHQSYIFRDNYLSDIFNKNFQEQYRKYRAQVRVRLEQTE